MCFGSGRIDDDNCDFDAADDDIRIGPSRPIYAHRAVRDYRRSVVRTDAAG